MECSDGPMGDPSPKITRMCGPREFDEKERILSLDVIGHNREAHLFDCRHFPVVSTNHFFVLLFLVLFLEPSKKFTCQNRETVPTPEGRLGHGTDLVHLAGGHEKMIYSAVTHGIMKTY